MVQLKSQHSLNLIDYNKYIRDKEILNMTNIKTVTNIAFGRELHYVLDNNYADAITQLTGKKTINDKDIVALMQLGLAVNNNTLQAALAS